jgi:glycogen debranching enzyme
MTDRPMSRQPWISDLSIGVRGNSTALGARSGDIGDGAEGVYVDDRRLLSRLQLRVDGGDLVPVVASARGAVTSSLTVARHLGDDGPDPTVSLRRTRTIESTGMLEEIVVESRAGEPVVAALELRLESDGAELHDVKGGRVRAPARVPSRIAGSTVTWADGRHELDVELSPAPSDLTHHDGLVTARWSVEVASGSSATVAVRCRVRRVAATDFDADPGADRLSLDGIRVTAADDRIERLAEVSAADFEGLLLTDPRQPEDCFAAAGTPWYLTLFGRDSLWAARLTLPYGTDLAGGTLRTLARRQGARHDMGSAEEPGKILHEVRRTTFADPSSHLRLPPVYYGTVDATALWVILLHDAWRWGLEESAVRDLLDPLVAGMGWIERTASAGDGLIRYEDTTGSGLSNQGWKDSGDAMRRRDGTVAPAPIALVESMAYAAEAAGKAAALVGALWDEDGEGLGERWVALGTRLTDTIRERFWVSDDAGPYLAMAIDGEGRHVDGVGSNMGHVLGTGVLTAEEAKRVADRLLGPDMLRRFGIGTLSADNPGYNPIGYHSGSVWVHDTAICAMGLALEGFGAEAVDVLKRILDLSARVGYRLPELLSGDTVLGDPVPYPASCRPQAWAAASGLALAPLCLGLRPNAPDGELTVAPLARTALGALKVGGLRLGGQNISVSVDSTGTVSVASPATVRVEVDEGLPPRA